MHVDEVSRKLLPQTLNPIFKVRIKEGNRGILVAEHLRTTVKNVFLQAPLNIVSPLLLKVVLEVSGFGSKSLHLGLTLANGL